MHNFGLPKTVFVRGEGCSLWDADGNRYTDMFSGIAVGGLGQAHPAVVRAVSEQMATLGHISNLFASVPQIELGERLAELATGGARDRAARVYFANSGTEANEQPSRSPGSPAGRSSSPWRAPSTAGRWSARADVTAKYREPFERLPGDVVSCLTRSGRCCGGHRRPDPPWSSRPSRVKAAWFCPPAGFLPVAGSEQCARCPVWVDEYRPVADAVASG